MDYFINISSYLKFQKKFGEMYEKTIENAASQIGLTKREAEVLLFFGNNPEYTTAIDAVKMRGFSKAYVSKAIEQLIGKGIAVAEQDKTDRRLQHIQLTKSADKIFDVLQKAQFNFFMLMTDGITDIDKETLARIIDKLMDNVNNEYNEP